MNSPFHRLHPPRPFILFCLAALAQVLFVRAAMDATVKEPLSIVIAAAFLAPFIFGAIALWPTVWMLATPPLLIVPGWFLGFTLAETLLLASMLLAALRGLAASRLPRSPSADEFLYGLFVLWAALSMSQVESVHDGWTGLRRVVVLFIAYLAGRRFLGPSHALRLVRSVAVLGTLIAIQLLSVFLASGHSLVALVSRVGSLTYLGWGYSNYIAAVTALTTAASIPLSFYGSPFFRILGITGLVSAILVSIATVSRGGTLAVTIGVLLALLVEGRRRFLASLGLFVLLATGYLASPLGQASLARFVEARDLPSIASRISYYQDSFQIAKEHPILGVGPDQIPFHSSTVMGPDPHNFLLKFAADFGVPGLACYLAVLGIAFRRAIRFLRDSSEPESRTLALAFFLVVTLGVVNGLYEPTLAEIVFGTVFWMMVGALLTASERSGGSARQPA